MYTVTAFYTKYGRKYIHDWNIANIDRRKKIADKAQRFIESCPPPWSYALSVDIEYEDWEKECKEVYIIDVKKCL